GGGLNEMLALSAAAFYVPGIEIENIRYSRSSLRRWVDYLLVTHYKCLADGLRLSPRSLLQLASIGLCYAVISLDNLLHMLPLPSKGQVTSAVITLKVNSHEQSNDQRKTVQRAA